MTMENAMSQGNMRTSSNTNANGQPGKCGICGKEPLCQGLGMVRYDVPVGHENFGKLFRCPNNPPEVDDAWQERLRAIGNLSAFADKSFDNFEAEVGDYSDEERASLQFALSAAYNYAQSPEGWLLFEGTYGSGKTHLAAAIGNARLSHGDAVLFITVPDLLDHLRSAYGPSSEVGYDVMFDRVRNAPLLILDDLGVENPSPWAQEKLFQLLNHRYSHKHPTVLTTNAELDKLDPRIRSRILDKDLIHIITMRAPDYRSLIPNRHNQLQSDLSHYGDMTFETFDIRRYVSPAEQQNLHTVANAAYSYAQTPEGWLVLMGGYGSGKTHLAAAIAQYRQQAAGDEVLFLTVPDLLDYLRVTYNPGAQITFDQRFQAVRNVPLLVLDDLGTENATPWAKEKLFQVIDSRYIAQRPTVITTAKSVEKLDERIRSRLLDDRRCAIFAITAGSYAERRRKGPKSS